MAAVEPFMTTKPVSNEIFSFSQRQYLWRFCVSTKGGLGGGGNVHPKGESSMVVPGLDVSSEPGGPDLDNTLLTVPARAILEWYGHC